jgi:glycosyltransferase involved in cell wall biosynthesis
MTASVIHVVDSLRVAGAERQLQMYLEETRSRNHRVIALSPYDGPRVSLPPWVRVQELRAEVRSDWASIVQLRRLLSGERRPLVCAWLFRSYALSAIALASKPDAMFVPNARNVNSFASPRHALVQRLAFARADAIVVNSSRSLPQLAGTASEGKVCFIPNGVRPWDAATLRRIRPEAREELGFDDEDVVIASIAHVKRSKDHATLLSAVESVRPVFPRLRVLWVGRGCRGLVGPLAFGSDPSEAHGHVFLEHTDDIQSVLAASDLFVLSSFEEGMPNALMEAMTAGLCCVASAVGAVPNLIRDGVDGRLLRTQSSGLLAGILSELLSKPDLRERLGETARERMTRDFSPGAMANAYDHLFRALAARRGKGLGFHQRELGRFD